MLVRVRRLEKDSKLPIIRNAGLRFGTAFGAVGVASWAVFEGSPGGKAVLSAIAGDGAETKDQLIGGQRSSTMYTEKRSLIYMMADSLEDLLHTDT